VVYIVGINFVAFFELPPATHYHLFYKVPIPNCNSPNETLTYRGWQRINVFASNTRGTESWPDVNSYNNYHRRSTSSPGPAS